MVSLSEAEMEWGPRRPLGAGHVAQRLERLVVRGDAVHQALRPERRARVVRVAWGPASHRH